MIKWNEKSKKIIQITTIMNNINYTSKIIFVSNLKFLSKLLKIANYFLVINS